MDGRAFESTTTTLEKILGVGRLLQQSRAAFLAEFGLSEVRYRVLGVLSAAGEEGLPQARLAEALFQAESSVCTLVERMYHDDLLCRRKSSTDRRKRMLFLTERGRTLWETARSRHDQEATTTMSRLTDEQHGTLSRLLSLLLSDLQDDLNDRPLRVNAKSGVEIPQPHFFSVGGAATVTESGHETLD